MAIVYWHRTHAVLCPKLRVRIRNTSRTPLVQYICLFTRPHVVTDLFGQMREPSPLQDGRRPPPAGVAVTKNAGFLSDSSEHVPWNTPSVSLPKNCHLNLSDNVCVPRFVCLLCCVYNVAGRGSPASVFDDTTTSSRIDGLTRARRQGASATSATADGLAPEGASQTKKFCLQVIKKRPRKPDVADVHEWCSAATRSRSPKQETTTVIDGLTRCRRRKIIIRIRDYPDRQPGRIYSNMNVSELALRPARPRVVNALVSRQLSNENSSPFVRGGTGSSALSLSVDISLSDSHFFEVLYIGKVRISQRKVPDTLIDDALNKFAQHEAEKAKNNQIRRDSLISLQGNMAPRKKTTLSKEEIAKKSEQAKDGWKNKNDPVLLAEYKEKERLKYLKKKKRDNGNV
ncbi:hypothetical protein EVAR_97170_1 [Eumeta japonica]|uniref:Uncharacterized protein n=1 Tax=Eumeta variegata TaxID=151549 RepID=A0A4C1XRU5_EUMVA|nr:hypothetical protein EVAR_97170_1 [Eumeta japonica]